MGWKQHTEWLRVNGPGSIRVRGAGRFIRQFLVGPVVDFRFGLILPEGREVYLEYWWLLVLLIVDIFLFLESLGVVFWWG